MASPYRADHVGSLLRPSDLLEARTDPNVTRQRLTAMEDRYILGVLKRQKDAGLRIFTDGELRRTGFMSDFYDSVEGLDPHWGLSGRGKGGPGGGSPPRAVGAPGGAGGEKPPKPGPLPRQKSD